MNTYLCAHCHAIWEDRSTTSICPNCSLITAKPQRSERQLSLQLSQSASQWSAHLQTGETAYRTAWNNKPSDKELYNWIKTLNLTLWTE